MKALLDRKVRLLFWLALLAALAGLLWYMVQMPGASYAGPLKPLTAEDELLMDNLRRHVAAIAGSERNVFRPRELEAAALYIERALSEIRYTPAAQRYRSGSAEVRNIEVEVPGGERAGEIVVVGAHYDTVAGSPGANDNGSGVAALMELARRARDWKPQRTLRFVAFVNEEMPFFQTAEMGSRVYAARSRERRENIVAMLSLETIGYYSDEPGSQRYPFPLGVFFPASGNFLAFVSNLSSRALLHEALAAFRARAAFPSEGVAAPAFVPGVDWSDHASFWREGYPAVMVTDTALYRYPYYHTSLDTPDKVDYERLARAVSGLQATVAVLARALH